MALDGGFLHLIKTELGKAEDSHIDKIYQPSRDELVLLLRKKGFAKRLIISARSGSARIHFTEQKSENPDSPPMFCMLARKHFSSARLTQVNQQGLERVLELCFDATNEMGDRVNVKIVCELIGNSSNIILVGSDNRIIDAVHRSDIETAKRIIAPGAVYEYPPRQDKLSLAEGSVSELTQKVLCKPEKPLSSALLEAIGGLSPLVSRELAYRVGCEDKMVADADAHTLETAISALKADLNDGRCYILFENGTPKDFSYTKIGQYGSLYDIEDFDTPSALLDRFYAERERTATLKRQSSDVSKTVNGLIARAKKRLALRLVELEDCKDREKFKIYGELIKANLYAIKSGMESVELVNFYDEQLRSITVPLDVTLSPANNAARYFKEYKKRHTAEQTLTLLIEKDKEEIAYLESVAQSLELCNDSADIEEIRDELRQGGYIRTHQQNRRKKPKTELKQFESREGYTILVGKNNLQNDQITCRIASKNDLWFHVKDEAGSHVVILCDGKEVSDETLLFAARLAAANSKAAASSKVAVDYTPIKYVKKPNGAKPGMVIYTTNKTVYVTPEEATS